MTATLDGPAELYRRALVEQNAGRPARALQLLGRALSAVDADSTDRATRELVTRIWTSTAYSRAESRDFDSGLEAVDIALTRATAAADDILVAEALSQRALIALRAGRLDLADEAFAAVGTRLEWLGDLARVSVLLNAGNLHLIRHEVPEARRAFRQVVQGAGDLPQQRFKALHNLAYTEFLAGDLPLALDLMDQAGRIDADVSRAIWLIDRSRVLAEAGLVTDADRSLAEAGEMLRRDRTFQDLGESELDRARCALISDDPASARRLAGRARDRFRRRGNDQWRRAAELVLLEADLADGRPGRRLVGPAERLRAELADAGLRGPARQASLLVAEARASAGDDARATAALRDLGRDSSADSISLRLRRRHLEARIAASAGKRARATAHISTGLNLLAKYQAQFGSVDLSSAAAVHGRRLAELDVALAVETKNVRHIFDAAERGRAVTNRLAAIRPPADEETAELLAELRQVVETLRAVELNPRASGPLTARRRDLEAAIGQRAWSRKGAGEVSAPASVEQAHAALGGSSLATFVVSSDRVGAVVLDRGRSRYVDLADRVVVIEHVRRIRADLDALAQVRLPAPMAASVRSSFQRSVTALDDCLLRPLNLDPAGVVLVTTGLLGQVPWGALPSLRGVPVEVAPSATAWLSARQIGRRVGGRRIVSVAGPGLVRSSAEADEVARAWKQQTSIHGSAATASALSKAMATARVVHVAAHGTHQNENPLFSSIRLADGPLFAHELDQTAGTPEHVVLSACELGLATIRPGDEALGLTSVLLRLGTRSVVAGVARIGDDVAADAMGAYHSRLARGMDSAAALAEVAEQSDSVLPLVCFGASWSAK